MSPFDAARYARLLEGLEVVELRLSEVRQENEKLRLDSGYFAKPMLAADAIARAYPSGCDDLGMLFSRFVKGIFDINASSYSDEGVPFLRILNLKNGVLDEGTLTFIPEAVHEQEIKTALKRGDIVLSKTAYPAASLVTVDRCNTSQDTIATTLSTYGLSTYRAEAVVAYLNSSFGKQLLWRQFQGNVQLHLGLDDGRKVPIPRLSLALQTRISETFQLAQTARRSASKAIEIAEATLIKILGLDGWQAPEPLSYVRRSCEAFAAGRLDAEFFSPRTNAIRAVLRAKGDLSFSELGLVSTGHPWRSDRFIERGSSEGVPFVRIRDCKPGAIDGEDLDRLPEAYAKEEAQPMAQPGDLVVGMDGLRWFYASSLLTPCYVNQRVGWLHSFEDSFPSAYLMVVLNSLIGQSQLLSQMTIAQTVGHITLDDLRNLRVPTLQVPQRAAIAGKFMEHVFAKRRASELFTCAKRAVEIAIEDSESAALKYLEAFT